jgi:hypothetical protein
MPLPTLETACFDADLPFRASPLPEGHCTPQQLRETRLALKVLAAPVDSVENTDPLLQRLEAKLDLALEMGLLSRYPERPPITACRLGLEAIGWHADQAIPPGTPVQLTLFPHPDSALVLYLAAHVSECVEIPAGGVQLTAKIGAGLNEYTLPLWEKWVFRRHRRAILDR